MTGFVLAGGDSRRMGADKALLLEGQAGMDGLATAKALAAELEGRDDTLVLFGVKAADDDQQQRSRERQQSASVFQKIQQYVHASSIPAAVLRTNDQFDRVGETMANFGPQY